MPSVMRALEGELVVKGPEGERPIPDFAFFKDYLFTALDPQEVVTEVQVPKLGSNTGWSCKR